jgi:hypothetical protein
MEEDDDGKWFSCEILNKFLSICETARGALHVKEGETRRDLCLVRMFIAKSRARRIYGKLFRSPK